MAMDPGGGFESVCVIPEDGADRLYAVVCREINGRQVRTIERMEPPVTELCEDAD